MEAQVDDVAVVGLCAAVPENTEEICAKDCETAQSRKRFSATTGVYRRRVCPPQLYFSDLAYAAAKRLLAELAWKESEVDALVVVTQSGDVAFPSTACILQKRLGLSTGCAAFDINLGCSGFPYGVLVASRLIGRGAGAKALMIIGDAAGKPNPAAPQPPLFGDAAVAVAFEPRSGAPAMVFSLHTDGEGWDVITARRPGGRPGLEESSFVSVTDSSGQVHIDMLYQMKGEDVFNFSVRVVPDAVRSALARRGWPADSVDAFVFHQASRLVNNAVCASLGLDLAKAPTTLDNFGNTSSATIPLTLVDQLGPRLREKNLRLLLCGFGVGLSWGTMTCELGPLVCPPLVEV